LSLPGCAFASATNSFSELAFTDDATLAARTVSVMRAIGAKSRSRL
jgi:hypothetical protein